MFSLILGARSATSFDEDASFYPMQNANNSGFYYFEKSDDRAFVITVEGDGLKLTKMTEESDISNYLFSIAGEFFLISCTYTIQINYKKDSM